MTVRIAERPPAKRQRSLRPADVGTGASVTDDVAGALQLFERGDDDLARDADRRGERPCWWQSRAVVEPSRVDSSADGRNNLRRQAAASIQAQRWQRDGLRAFQNGP